MMNPISCTYKIIQVQSYFTFDEEPKSILDREVKQL